MNPSELRHKKGGELGSPRRAGVVFSPLSVRVRSLRQVWCGVVTPYTEVPGSRPHLRDSE